MSASLINPFKKWQQVDGLQGIKDTTSISTFAVMALGFRRKKAFGSGGGMK
jgi:hypothetical protein